MRIVVTRPRAQAEPLVRRLAELGHEVVVCPLIAIEPIEDGPVDTTAYEWVVVTSPNGARELARRHVGELRNVAAIGRATASELRRHGITPALVPRVATQEGLLEELGRPHGRVLVAAAEGARRLLVDKLDADFRALYRTTPLRPDPPTGDIVVLASGSAARAFAELGVEMGAVTIGPQTTRAALAAGIRVIAEAATHDLDGLVAAVEDVCSSRS